MFLSRLYRFIASSLTMAALSALCLPTIQAAPPSASDAQQILDGLPLYFEVNEGQAAPAVKFLSRSGDHALFLTPRAAVLTLDSRVLRMHLRGGNDAPCVEGQDRLPSKSAYFLGNRPENWRTGVEHFAKVRYQQVYAGIDLIYYGNKQRLEHDFVVSPGADARLIRMAFDGADGLTLTADGSLVLSVGERTVEWSAPLAYVGAGSRRSEVAARFVKTGDREVGFLVGSYDRSKTLVIDPVLSYSTFHGGSNFDLALDVATDSAGNIIVMGLTNSDDYPTNGVGLQPGGGNKVNVFIAKLSPFATGLRGLLYSSFFGGAQDEEAAAMIVDSQDNIYVTGTTASGDFPTTDNAVQKDQPARNDNGYLVKFNIAADPKMLFGSYLGGDATDRLYGLAVDSQQRAYVVGTSDSQDYPLSGDPLQNSGRGPGDAVLSIVDTDAGGLVYSTYLGGTNNDFGTAVAVAAPGRVFLTGFTSSDDFPVKENPYQGKPRGRGDGFLTEINWTTPGLEGLGYSSYIGGTDLDVPYGIIKDPSGVYHLTGYTLSRDFPTTAAAVQRTNGGNADVFLTTIDPSKPGGEGLVYSTYFGGSGADVPYKMMFDSAGALVLAGYTMSDDLRVVGDFYQNSFSGISDAFFARIDPRKPAGEGLTCSSYLGGELSDVAWGMFVDNMDNMYFVGETMSKDFPVTGNALIGVKPGVVSAFVTKFPPCAVSDSGSTGANAAARAADRGRGPNRTSRGGGRGH